MFDKDDSSSIKMQEPEIIQSTPSNQDFVINVFTNKQI